MYAGGVDEAALLDGFTITAGNADHPDENPYRRGGGVYKASGSPAIERCTFRANSADYQGGGMYSSSGNEHVTDCMFTDNITGGNGGGFFNSQGDAMLLDCTFTDNVATSNGGGVYVYNGGVTLTACTFETNSANPLRRWCVSESRRSAVGRLPVSGQHGVYGRGRGDGTV